jgi:hypothetical protein
MCRLYRLIEHAGVVRVGEVLQVACCGARVCTYGFDMSGEVGCPPQRSLPVSAMSAMRRGSSRNGFWEHLIVNAGIVLVFAAFYLRFVKRS